MGRKESQEDVSVGAESPATTRDSDTIRRKKKKAPVPTVIVSSGDDGLRDVKTEEDSRRKKTKASGKKEKDGDKDKKELRKTKSEPVAKKDKEKLRKDKEKDRKDRRRKNTNDESDTEASRSETASLETRVESPRGKKRGSMLFGGVILEAVSDYQGTEGELSFSTGDQITFLEMDDSGWVKGSLKDKEGWFPREAVQSMGKNDPFSLLDAARRQDSKDESSLIENRKSTSQALNKFLVDRKSFSEVSVILPEVTHPDGDEKNKQKKKTMGLLKGIFGTKGKEKRGKNIFSSNLADLCGCVGETQTVPLILVDCVAYFEAQDVAQIDGIFRKSGVQTDVDALKALYTGPDVTIDLVEETEDPHVIGGLMKQFLGSLVNPVVPFNMYSSLMQEYKTLREKYSSDRKVAQKLAKFFDDLPPAHYNTLCYLVRFLAKIATHQKSTKMGAANLGTVFGPNIIRPLAETTDSLLDTTNAKILELCIDQHKHVFSSKSKPKLLTNSPCT